jgi:hypothetical protein
MLETAESAKTGSGRESSLSVYPPSWIDRFNARVTRLPGLAWVYYLGIGLALFILQIAVFWSEGAYPVGTFIPAHGFIAGLMPAILALVHYLDNRADAALLALRPALKTTETECSELYYRLTTLPARPALVASLAGAIFVVLITESLGRPSSYQGLATSPISATLVYCMYVAVWWAAGAFLYHTVHQLRVINHIYTEHTRIDLLRMRPLYAFSGVTALTAVSLTGMIYGWSALNPGMLQDPTSFVVILPITGLALVVFAWPLLGAHRLLVREKERMLDEASLRFEAAIVELHRRLDEGQLEDMDNLNKAIASLEIERNIWNRIPTWPWEPETLRLLITALALPLGLWIIQYLLQQALGS